MEWYEWLAVIIGFSLIALLVLGLFASVSSNEGFATLNNQANRDCVQLGYDGGEVAPDMPDALRCWTIILVDGKGQ